MSPLVRLLALAAIGVAACSPAVPTPVPAPPSSAGSLAPVGSPSPTGAASGPRSIVITTDLAGDDLMAVMAMLREPAVDVLAIAVASDSATDAGLFLGGVRAPKTWADAIAVLEAIELDGPEPELPDWIIPVEGAAFAGPGRDASAFLSLPAGEAGVVCAAGEFPDLDFTDGGSFTIR